MAMLVSAPTSFSSSGRIGTAFLSNGFLNIVIFIFIFIFIYLYLYQILNIEYLDWIFLGKAAGPLSMSGSNRRRGTGVLVTRTKEQDFNIFQQELLGPYI